MRSRSEIEVDIETTGLDPLLDVPLLIALDEVVFLAPRTRWVEALTPILENPKIEKIIHNAPFDSMFFQKEAIRPRGVVCTSIAARLLRSGLYSETGTFSLVNLLDKCLGVKLDAEHKAEMQMSFVGVDPASFWPSEEQLDYVCGDTAYLSQLAAYFRKQLAERGMLDVWKLECAFTQVLASMQLHGTPFDVVAYEPIVVETEAQLAEVQARLSETLTPPILDVRLQRYLAESKVRKEWEEGYEKATVQMEWTIDTGSPGLTKGERRKRIQESQAAFRELHPRPSIPKLDTSPINLNSTDQVLGALAQLGINPDNTERDTLLRLKASTPECRHQLLDDLAEYSRLEKLLSSYGRGLMERVHPDGRLRSNYELVGTGRLSSSKWKDKVRGVERGWNSQNAHPKCKSAVVAPSGRTFVIVDYAQIELRVAAELILMESPTAQDALVKAFRDGMDPHSLTAAEVSGIPYEEIQEKKETDSEIANIRKGAKTTNFSVVFGIAAPKLAVRIYADRGSKGPFGKAQVDEAQAMIKAFWRLNPTLQKVLKKYGKQALDQGFTTTLLGRRRFYKKLAPGTAEWHAERASIERQASNAPIQGTAADIVKIAAVLIYVELGPQEFIWNAVHDELCVEGPEGDKEHTKEVVKRCCLKAFALVLKHIPGDVSIGDGKQWKH